MAVAYAKQQGGDVWRANPDGWCLLACVEHAMSGTDRTLLLQQALHVISEGGVAEASQQSAAAEMLLMVGLPSSQRQLDQKVAKLWDSEVWDAMPSALSRVVGRPLHIVSGNVRSGQVSLTVVDEAVGAAEADPVRLIRSGHEYGCAHYDLVEAQLPDHDPP